jgi:hypothetical protein
MRDLRSLQAPILFEAEGMRRLGRNGRQSDGEKAGDSN